MDLKNASPSELQQWAEELEQQHQQFKAQSLSLDITRGKPSGDQLSLADHLDGCLRGNYTTADGIDTRNYGGISGIREMRQLGADILGLSQEEVSAQGNSSLSLMFLALLTAKQFGLRGPESAWDREDKPAKFICPVPGYDRHFTLCEQLDIEMLTVPMTDTGPSMDDVEAMVKADPSIKGMWCVPKYSNPTGVIYSDETVERIAKLGNIAGDNFCVFWDNAYAVHDLQGMKPLANVMDYCRQQGTENSVIQFASTSKVTFAGAGVAFIGASQNNITGFHKALSTLSIGPDKVNQLRHHRFFPDYQALLDHMQHHAGLLRPRFECVLTHLEKAFGDNELGSWTPVDGGYFISFDSKPGLAKTIIALAADAGVKLTPAGATFPYGKDPNDCNIRIAPSVPSLEQVNKAMEVFVVCVKLASVKQVLDNQ